MLKELTEHPIAFILLVCLMFAATGLTIYLIIYGMLHYVGAL